jgi:hypothetical protein
MPSPAIFAQGTHLQRGNGDGPPETFTTVAKVYGDLPFPQLMSGVKETTDHDSPDSTMEFVATLIDPGQLKFSVYYRPQDSTHKQLIADAQARDSHNWQIVMVDAGASVWAFAGIVIGFQPKGPSNDMYTADVTIQVTGSVTPPA